MLSDKLHGNVKLRKRWLSRTYDLDYKVEGQSTPILLSKAINAILTKPPIGPLMNSSKELLNEKGLDIVEIGNSDRPSATSKILEIEVAIGGSSGTEAPLVPCIVTLEATFSRFEGTGGIVHQLERKRTGGLPKNIPTTSIGRIFPAQPERIELGMERFRVQSISNLFGSAPVADLRFGFSATSSMWQFWITGEALTKHDLSPIPHYSSLECFCALLSQVQNINVADDFTRALAV